MCAERLIGWWWCPRGRGRLEGLWVFLCGPWRHSETSADSALSSDCGCHSVYPNPCGTHLQHESENNKGVKTKNVYTTYNTRNKKDKLKRSQ